jgi:DNA-directed RNA polymerase subunit RPC12/RpoP
MFKNRDKIIARVANMPDGEFSPTDRYWCMTCKMLFDIDKPVCPYMTRVCINTPIPVELEPPETTASLEKFGLFYPKIPQQVMAHLARQADAEIGGTWAQIYLDFLKDWRFPYTSEPLQTLKSFIIVVGGCETGQRVREGKITFILTDRHKVWEGDHVYDILNAGIGVLKEELGVEQEIDFDELAIVGDAPTGKYFCAMCRKFFEFSLQRKTITCPIMPQKCMATPLPLETSKYSLMDLMTVYNYTPDLYRRLITPLPNREEGIPYLKKLLQEEWLFTLEDEPLQEIQRHLGLVKE